MDTVFHAKPEPEPKAPPEPAPPALPVLLADWLDDAELARIEKAAVTDPAARAAFALCSAAAVHLETLQLDDLRALELAIPADLRDRLALRQATALLSPELMPPVALRLLGWLTRPAVLDRANEETLQATFRRAAELGAPTVEILLRWSLRPDVAKSSPLHVQMWRDGKADLLLRLAHDLAGLPPAERFRHLAELERGAPLLFVLLVAAADFARSELFADFRADEMLGPLAALVMQRRLLSLCRLEPTPAVRQLRRLAILASGGPAPVGALAPLQRWRRRHSPRGRALHWLPRLAADPAAFRPDPAGDDRRRRLTWQTASEPAWETVRRLAHLYLAGDCPGDPAAPHQALAQLVNHARPPQLAAWAELAAAQTAAALHDTTAPPGLRLELALLALQAAHLDDADFPQRTDP